MSRSSNDLNQLDELIQVASTPLYRPTNSDERRKALKAFMQIALAARQWEMFKQANPHEAELIEAGVAVSDALKNKEP